MTPTIIPTLDFGAPITPTAREVRRAYSRIGALIWWHWTRLVRWLAPKEEVRPIPDGAGGSDLDAARGIINAAILGFWTFVVVSWGISQWV